MKIIDCGVSGSSSPPDLPGWEELGLSEEWVKWLRLWPLVRLQEWHRLKQLQQVACLQIGEI